MKHNKFYGRLTKDQRANKYSQFPQKKTSVVFEVRQPRSDDTHAALEEVGIETLEYSICWAHYRIRKTKKGVKTHTDRFKRLIREARDRREWQGWDRGKVPSWSKSHPAQELSLPQCQN